MHLLFCFSLYSLGICCSHVQALFLSLYKSFSNVLMERLPEASAAPTLNELKSMHVDEMSVDPEEKSAMDLDNEDETNQNRFQHLHEMIAQFFFM